MEICKKSGKKFRIRECVKEDCQVLHSMVIDLAIYEREPVSTVTQTVEDYEKAGFETENPLFKAVFAEIEEDDGFLVVGMATYFYTFNMGRLCFKLRRFIRQRICTRWRNRK